MDSEKQREGEKERAKTVKEQTFTQAHKLFPDQLYLNGIWIPVSLIDCSTKISRTKTGVCPIKLSVCYSWDAWPALLWQKLKLEEITKKVLL